MSAPGYHLVVIGDSTAFTDETGHRLPDDPATYPRRVSDRLEAELGAKVTTSVLARPGNTVREAVRLVTKDRHAMFEVLAKADAVVVGVGSFDHAPVGVPPSVDALLPYLRPATLRRRARRASTRLSPHLIRVRGGRRPRTPPAEFERLFRLLLEQIRGLTQGRAAGVVLGPTSHTSWTYGHRHPGVGEATRRQLDLAVAHGFGALAVWPLVRGAIGRLNPDGIHWPADVHHRIGDAAAELVAERLQGDAPLIGLPGTPAAQRSTPGR